MAEIRIGGSSAERIIFCPGSVTLSSGAPDNESAEAKDGTLAHKLAELCFAEGLHPDEMVGRFIGNVEIDATTAEAVAVYVEHVSSRFTNSEGQIDLERKAQLRVEADIDLSIIDPVCKGRCDDYLYLPNERVLYVDDYKHGAGVAVEVLENKQLMFYALGALFACGGPVETIVLTVIQPNCPHEDGPVRTISVTPDVLFEFGMQLKAAIERSRTPKAPLKAGRWCQFCKASGFCPEQYRHVRKALDHEAQDAMTADMGGALDPDEVGKRLGLIEPIKHWITGIQRYAFNEAQRGRVPSGYKLVASVGRRKWKGDAQAKELVMREAARVFHVDEDALFNKRPITPRQLEQTVGVKRAAEFIKAHIDTTTKRPVSLVPVSDRRNAVEPSIDLEFADLTENSDE
jgi:hypothetical protein